jgi:hypothetical protein
MQKWRWAAIALLLIALYGAQKFVWDRRGDAQVAAALPDDSRSVLDNSQKFVLLALYPHAHEEPGEWRKLKAKKIFHGYRVLGETTIASKIEKRKLLQELYNGMKFGRTWNMAACFQPRHAIRAQWQNETVDFVICFSCRQYKVYRYGKRWRDDFPITDSPRETFDDSLSRAGITNPY